MSTTQKFTGTLELVGCPECCIQFGIPLAVEQQLRGNHQTFYCPRGHPLSFREKSESDRLRDSLLREQERVQQQQRELDRQREYRQHAERSAAAYKGQTTRLRKRIAAGVCPCCQRQFQNLRTHMAQKHPDFVGSADA